MPRWVHAATVLVILVSGLVAAKVVSMLVLLPFLVLSSVGRRFASTAKRVEIDADGFHLDGQSVARSEVRDVWIDADPSEPRAVLAHGTDCTLVVIHFENREQARRFGDELGANELGINVVGYRPTWIDTLSSLRFVAIALAFFATGSPYGLFILVFFALGGWAVLQAKQLIAGERSFELRGLIGSTTYSYEDVTGVDTDAGSILLKNETEIAIPRSVLRDATLASGTWLERGRTRALEHIRSRARSL